MTGLRINQWVALGMLALAPVCFGKKSKPTPTITVPAEPGMTAAETAFVDKKVGVSFQVPAGWELAKKDGQVSTFRTDARTAQPSTQMRGVAVMDFNPYPQSTFSGAAFYFSVEPKTNDGDCSRQASTERTQPRTIGGMPFVQGHEEHGGICIESRDEVFTAFHNHACYRFDLAIHTFCAISSGAREVTEAQVRSIDARMAAILSTVRFEWEKGKSDPQPPPSDAQTPSPTP
jgi:hypothetical protein